MLSKKDAERINGYYLKVNTPAALHIEDLAKAYMAAMEMLDTLSEAFGRHGVGAYGDTWYAAREFLRAYHGRTEGQ